MAYLPFPSGTLLTFAGPTAPDGWLLCDGSAVSRTTYARLFAAISTTYGNGDGALTFNLPDLRGVYPRGAGTNGTANYGGVTGHTPAAGALATKGGQKTAKNGLANASATTTSSGNRNQFDRTSGTVSSDHVHGTGGGGGHSHFVTYGNYGYDDNNGFDGQNGERVQASDAPDNDFGVYADAVGDHTHGNTGGISANHTHTVTYDSTFSVSGTTPAQTISGDTETTPAFLAVNYIIKL